jgi:hypothetical protein
MQIWRNEGAQLVCAEGIEDRFDDAMLEDRKRLTGSRPPLQMGARDDPARPAAGDRPPTPRLTASPTAGLRRCARRRQLARDGSAAIIDVGENRRRGPAR